MIYLILCGCNDPENAKIATDFKGKNLWFGSLYQAQEEAKNICKLQGIENYARVVCV